MSSEPTVAAQLCVFQQACGQNGLDFVEHLDGLLADVAAVGIESVETGFTFATHATAYGWRASATATSTMDDCRLGEPFPFRRRAHYRGGVHNNLPVDPLLAERLEGMYGYAAWTARPDFTHPSLNDSGGVSGSAAAWAARGGELFGRDDLRWAATSGKDGSPPDFTSRAFEDAGVYVMRSGWDPDARYLILDAGPYSAAHQHEDKLSFDCADLRQHCQGRDRAEVLLWSACRQAALETLQRTE